MTASPSTYLLHYTAPILKGVLAFAGVVSVVMAIWSIAAETARDDEIRKLHAVAHKEAARIRIETDCLDRDQSAAIAECVEEIVDEARGNERDEHDLNAQRGMERWAFWMMLTSAGGMFITLIGVIFVARTLTATLSAAESSAQAATAANRSNDIARAELRPWLTLLRETKCIFSVMERDPSSEFGQKYPFYGTLKWKYRVKNKGKSPGFGLRVRTKLNCFRSFFDAHIAFQRFISEIDYAYETNTEETIFPDETTGMITQELTSFLEWPGGSDKPKFYFMIVIVYRSQESDVLGIEARLVQVSYDDLSLGPWSGSLLEIASSRVTR